MPGSPPVPDRVRADACPGVFATHPAKDGLLARVRLPGGALTGAQAIAVAECAETLGDGAIHLTSRANLQLRAVRDEGKLVAALSGAGLLPKPSHERVRNILGSPLSGLSGGRTDIRPLVAELDRKLCATPELASLPGRFLFAFDDGRGDVAGEGADVAWRAITADSGAVLLAGADTGSRVPKGEAAAALIALAVTFQRIRGTAWRMRELGAEKVMALTGTAEPPLRAAAPPDIGEHDGVVVAAPVLGTVSSAELRVLGRRGAVVVTPWRTLVLSPEQAGAVPGLLTDPSAPLAGVSACAGSPGCARSLADVRADARSLSERGTGGRRVHFSGCERRCGRPSGDHADVLAEREGYRADGTWVATSDLAVTLRGRQ
ncbi:precorrin-3B synthase [Prauserella marina]|uniref:precorrin-3B synthase n=1 Tax=Prauserella marina TaxID=530584 RepID=UPI000B88D6C9|nr:precorrin-3B synthase [Prauserella marina]